MKKYETAKAIRADLMSRTATEEARAEYRAIRKAYAANRDALVECHHNATKAAETVAALVALIGYENAAEIVAVMVVCKGTWDERISARCRAWAADIVTATADELRETLDMYYSDSIHPAHLDQIARAMMAYTPAETPETPDTPDNTTDTESAAESEKTATESESPTTVQTLDLVSEQDAQKVAEGLGINPGVDVGDLKPGDIFTAGGFEFVLLEQTSAGAACVLRGTYGEDVIFGDNNNYNGSNVDKICEEFADKLEKETGAKLVNFSADLVCANGMKDYGQIMRRASLLTLDQLQRYTPILATCSPSAWWWLATACGSDTWGGSSYALCVSPLGFINCFHGNCRLGVRPFCIFPASLSVSL